MKTLSLAVVLGALCLGGSVFAQGASPPGGTASSDTCTGASCAIGAGGMSTDGGVVVGPLGITFNDATTQTTAATAPTGTLNGRTLLRQSTGDFAHYAMPMWLDRKVMWVVPSEASATATLFGAQYAAYSTATDAVAAGYKAIRFTSTAAANNRVGPYTVPANSNTLSLGTGFHASIKFGFSSAWATPDVFVGLAPTQLGSAGTPSALANSVYVGCDEGESTLRVASNDATGSATKHADLGASFPCTTSGATYWVQFYATPGDTAIDYRVERLDSAATASGTISSDLPSSATALLLQAVANTGATAVASSLDFIHFYAETP